MSQEASQQTQNQGGDAWRRLWRELAIRTDNSVRPLPDQVEHDLVTLRGPQAETPDDNAAGDLTAKGDVLELTVPAPQTLDDGVANSAAAICERLQTFRYDVEFMEGNGLTYLPGAGRAQEALYSYLSSERSWSDFRVFERELASCELLPLGEKVFARDAGSFLGEFHERWRESRRVAEFPKFMSFVERSIEYWDAPALQSLWTTMYEGVQQGKVSEQMFTRVGRLVVEHDRMNAPELQKLLEGITHHSLSDTMENGTFLVSAGRMLASRAESPSSVSPDDFRSDPRVEFGYLATRIHQLAIQPATHRNQCALVGAYRRAAEHAVPSDPWQSRRTWRDEALATIRGYALQSMHVRSEGYAREIIAAAMPLLKESWHDNTSIVFRELIGFGTTASRGIVLETLRNLMAADTVTYALREQCGIREGSFFREDRRKFVALLRDAIRSERERGADRDPRYLRQLFGLLGCLSDESRVAIPDVLGVLGIGAIRIGPLGFTLSPWKEAKDPDPHVRAAARRFARIWEDRLSGGIRRRLQQDEDSEISARRSE